MPPIGEPEIAPSKEKSEGRHGQWFLRRAHQRQVTVAAQQLNIRVDIMIRRNRIQYEIEAPEMLLHFIGISRHHHLIRPQPHRVIFLVG